MLGCEACWPPSIVLLAVLLSLGCGRGSAAELPRLSVEVVRPRACTVLLAVEAELALTPESRTRGLMERHHLARNHGMLFSFDQPQPLHFWMFNTLIPLDIIFADEHRRITTIHASVPPCLPPWRCPTYASEGPAQFVLEVNGGVAAEAGVRIGDEVRWAQPCVGRC